MDEYFLSDICFKTRFDWKGLQCENLTQCNDQVFLKVMERTVFRWTFFTTLGLYGTRALCTVRILTLSFRNWMWFSMIRDIFILGRERVRPNFRKKLRFCFFGEIGLRLKRGIIFETIVIIRTNERVKRVHNRI